jgi:hypothetical protein
VTTSTPQRFLAALLLAALSLQPAAACSVCYGEPDSAMTRGLTWAILALGAVVGVVLSGVVMFFVHIGRRSADMSGDDGAAAASKSPE